MTEILLHWQGPYRFQEILANSATRNDFDVPGVYLWIESAPGGDRVCYIGKATGSPSLMMRHLQHYMFYMGACYSVPGWFRNSERDWSLDLKDQEVVSTIFNKEKLFPLISQSLDYANHLQVFLAKAPRDTVKDIERNLLYDLKPSGTKGGTLTPPRVSLQIGHKNAKWAYCLPENDKAKLTFL
jgi:hypothetical protein